MLCGAFRLYKRDRIDIYAPPTHLSPLKPHHPPYKQVSRGNELNAQAGLKAQCRSVQGDFMALPFPDESFDGAYAIEATCHAPDRTKVGRWVWCVCLC